MGFKDDITVLFGSGIDLASKKAETVKLQADLTKTNAAIEAAYAALGRAVLQGEASNQSFLSAYEASVKLVRDLEKHAAETGMRIEELNRIPAAQQQLNSQLASTVPTGACPSCGAIVSVSSLYCPTCGNNLQQLKEHYLWCPTCNTYSDEGMSFCINCGSRLRPLPVAPERAVPASGEQMQEEPTVPDPPSAPVCPSCGNPVNPEDAFCGACGTRLNA